MSRRNKGDCCRCDRLNRRVVRVIDNCGTVASLRQLFRIMIRQKLYAPASALPAIAAALALSSTPLSAQEAQPVPADPPATAVQPAPVVADPTPATPDTATAPD